EAPRAHPGRRLGAPDLQRRPARELTQEGGCQRAARRPPPEHQPERDPRPPPARRGAEGGGEGPGGCGGAGPRMSVALAPAVRLDEVTKVYGTGRGAVPALDRVSL